MTLTLAIPSKGRLKEQTEAYLADCGLKLRQMGGDRGYTATLEGAPNVNVLLSASEIAKGLLGGSLHLGVTGEDLLREHADNFDEEAWLLKRWVSGLRAWLLRYRKVGLTSIRLPTSRMSGTSFAPAMDDACGSPRSICFLSPVLRAEGADAISTGR